MKKLSFITLLLSFIAALSFSAFAREAIPSVNLDVVHTKNETTINDIYVQANTPHYTCEKKEFSPVTQHVILYLRAADGFIFTMQNASQVTLTGASYIRATKQESSSLLLLTIALPDDITWLEDRGGWQNDENGIKYQLTDGTHTTEGWNKINGKDYYFNADGYVLISTTTPDGYKVNSEGEWDNKSPGIAAGASNEKQSATESQSVSNITYTSDSITTELTISDYIYNDSLATFHIFEITNNSPHTLEISINETAKNSSGNVVGAGSTSQEDIPSGCTVFVTNYLSDVKNATSFDTSIQTKASEYYTPVIQNITVNTTNLGEKVIVSATNNGTVVADFVQATAVFFDGGKVAYVSSTFLVDSDSELKPGASISEQISAYKSYTSVKVHITGRRSVWDN